MDDLENLLKNQEYAYDLFNENKPLQSNEIKKQKANKGADIFDLIKMIASLTKIQLKNCIFEPDEGKIITLDSMKTINKPVITYSVKSEVPLEIKPRLREEIEDLDELNNEKRLGQVWGQKFQCILQFNIMSSVYKETEEVMKIFEELIFNHTGYFKQNGVAEIVFHKRFTDSDFSNLREKLSVRNLQYEVTIEKLIVSFADKIKNIELLAQKEE